MIKQIKITKILVVIFLTLLIWVWADRAQDEQEPVSRIPVQIAESTDPSLLISFWDAQQTALTDRVFLENIDLKGPASRIEKIRTQKRIGTLDLGLTLVPKDAGLTEPTDKMMCSLLDFVRRSPFIRRLGLTVESCMPETVYVQVIRLEKKTVDVRCVDSEAKGVPGATIKPSKIEMFVPAEWQGQSLVATVQLDPGDRDRARVATVTKTPFIEVGGRRRKAQVDVQVRIPLQEDRLKQAFIDQPKLGLLMSPTIQKDYRIQLRDETTALSRIAYRATDEAKRAYENESYHVVLVIDRVDPLSLSQRKPLEYRFPKEFMPKDIVLDQEPLVIDFELIPRSDVEAGPSTE